MPHVQPAGRSPQERSTKADEYAEEIRGGLPSDEGPTEIGKFELRGLWLRRIDPKYICVVLAPLQRCFFSYRPCELTTL